MKLKISLVNILTKKQWCFGSIKTFYLANHDEIKHKSLVREEKVSRLNNTIQ